MTIWRLVLIEESTRMPDENEDPAPSDKPTSPNESQTP